MRGRVRGPGVGPGPCATVGVPLRTSSVAWGGGGGVGELGVGQVVPRPCPEQLEHCTAKGVPLAQCNYLGVWPS